MIRLYGYLGDDSLVILGNPNRLTLKTNFIAIGVVGSYVSDIEGAESNEIWR